MLQRPAQACGTYAEQKGEGNLPAELARYWQRVGPEVQAAISVVVKVLAACYFTAAYLGERLKIAILARRILRASKRFFAVPVFHYYALADGIVDLLAHATRGPLCAPRPPDGALKLQPLLFEI